MLSILMIVFLALLALGCPIAIGMCFASFVALFWGNTTVPLTVVPQRMFVTIDSFSMMAIPLFILAGELMNSAGITRRIINFCSALVGHIRGGLAHVNILASMLFAGISGAAAADSASLGSMLIPAMIEDGYDADFSVAVTATSSTIGPIIPPSIMMIIYGSMAGVSIGALFMGGVIPGILIGIVLMVIAYIISCKRGYKAEAKKSLGEIFVAFKESLVALVMPLIVLGGILFGIFTTTEAGCIAVVYALIAGAAMRELHLKDLFRIFLSAALTTASTMFVLASAQALGWILARAQFPQMVVKALLGVSDNGTVIFLLILLFLFVLGFFMDGTAAMIILIPVFLPVIAQYGWDPIQFADCIIMMLLVGAVTPPVGVLLFICCGIAKISIAQAAKAVWPFVFGEIAVILLCVFIPQLITFLPDMIYGG